MSNAYRELAIVEKYEEPAAPVGLVRAHKMCYRGRCGPPGILWTWWHNVREDDKFFCKHGLMWELSRYNDWILRVSR